MQNLLNLAKILISRLLTYMLRMNHLDLSKKMGCLVHRFEAIFYFSFIIFIILSHEWPRKEQFVKSF